MRTLSRYVIGHWNGQQGFAWSFWVNLVFIRVVAFKLHDLVVFGGGGEFSNYRALILVFAGILHGVVFIWQVVGLLRAADIHVQQNGSMAPVWGAQLALIVAFLWVMTYFLDAWQATEIIPSELQSQAEMQAERAAKYSIEPTADGQSLALTGSIELGITKHLIAQLDAYPHTRQIVLSSAGGNIYSARGLSQIIRRHELDTLVKDQCSSACTIVFIGGKRRQLLPQGRLGFHQYRIDADYSVLNANPVAEQERDRALFLAAGVAGGFLDKIFASSGTEMWFPEASELIEAGFATGIVSPETDR